MTGVGIVINTTTSGLQRTIQLLISSGEVERYALARRRDGGVAWRHDTFDGDGSAPGVETWIAYGGRVTVGQVLDRVPSCRREILEWTRNEIAEGTDDPSLDLFSRAERQSSLALLEAELRFAVSGLAA